MPRALCGLTELFVLLENKRLAGMIERAEQSLVQQHDPEPAVEALDEGILGRLARRDIMPLDAPP